MTYKVTNLHSVRRSYKAGNGQYVAFGPGEQKQVETRPPSIENLWSVEEVEESGKTTESKDGGEN